MRGVIHFQAVHLQPKTHALISLEDGRATVADVRYNLGTTENKLSAGDLPRRERFDAVGKYQRTGSEFFVRNAWDGKPLIDHSDIATVDILDDEIELIKTGPQRNGLLIARVGIERSAIVHRCQDFLDRILELL